MVLLGVLRLLLGEKKKMNLRLIIEEFVGVSLNPRNNCGRVRRGMHILESFLRKVDELRHSLEGLDAISS